MDWISLKDEKPELGKDVEVLYENGSYGKAKLISMNLEYGLYAFSGSGDCNNEGSKITHWRQNKRAMG